EVDSALRPAVAFGGRDDVVDERGGPADVEVGAERLGRQGIREYAEEVGAVGEDAGGVGEGGDVVEVCAAAGPVHVEQFGVAAPLSGGAQVRDHRCDTDSGCDEQVLAGTQNGCEGAARGQDGDGVADGEVVDPAGAALAVG